MKKRRPNSYKNLRKEALTSFRGRTVPCRRYHRQDSFRFCLIIPAFYRDDRIVFQTNFGKVFLRDYNEVENFSFLREHHFVPFDDVKMQREIPEGKD